MHARMLVFAVTNRQSYNKGRGSTAQQKLDSKAVKLNL